MSTKYKMTREENIFAVNRNIVDYIWKSAKLEGLNISYSDTEAIYNGMRAPSIKVDEIIAVNNLKHAWKYILDNLDVPMDCNYVCHLNKKVGGDNLIINAGYLRKVPVSIGGTSWKPDMPIESQIKEQMEEINKISDPTDRAINMMLYLVRKQMFLDGNKRTSMLAGNQIMIANGCGIISVPIEYQSDFTEMLVRFYETNDQTEITKIIYDHCIDGIDFRQNEELSNKQEIGGYGGLE